MGVEGLRPSGLFDEYREFVTGDLIKFEGVLVERFRHVPKSQIAFGVAGGEYKSFDIRRVGLEVSGSFLSEIGQIVKIWQVGCTNLIL